MSLLLQLTAALVKGFTVAGFGASFWGALVIISLVSSILNMLLVVEQSRVEPMPPSPSTPADHHQSRRVQSTRERCDFP